MSMNNTLKSDGDHLYYNIAIKSNDRNDGIAVFDDNRTEAILTNPSDYELAVIRFSVPSQNIPIFLWTDDLDFQISLEYQGSLYSAKLQWFPNTSFSPPFKDWYGKAVWNYNNLINSINLGFLTAFNALKLANPTAPYLYAPVMTYSPETKLCSMYVEPTYDHLYLSNPIYVWFNESLGNKFPAFQNIVSNDPLGFKIFKMIFVNNITNNITISGIDYLVSQEEFSTLSLWSDLRSIVFETDLPVITESIGSQTNKYRRVLTDFEPESQIADRSTIQYFATGLPRFYDLVSSYPLNRVSIRVLWETKSGEFYPLRLTKTDLLSIKLYFKRKGTMINF